jgi:hypothetical protein
MSGVPLAEGLLALDAYLQAGILDGGRGLDRIGTALAAGRLVLLREAFHPTFAERVHACLEVADGWVLHEDYSESYFHYRHHNLYDESRYPADLRWCQAVFASAPTRSLVARLTGRACTGRTVLSASWYRPGDHSLPHTDLVDLGGPECRQVAFIWHLTRGWQPGWGGDLYWCPADRYLAPSFNTLILFAIGRQTRHFVTTVAPHATGKRLAVNGWWTGPGDPTAGQPAAPVTDPAAMPRLEVL